MSQLLLRFDDGSTPALETSAQRLVGKLTHLPGEQESRPLEIVSSNQAAATKVSSLQSLPQLCNQLNLYRNPKCTCHSGDSRKLHPKLFRYLTMRMARLIVSGLAVIPDSWNRNRLTSKLGIDYAIIQGPLGGFKLLCCVMPVELLNQYFVICHLTLAGWSSALGRAEGRRRR